MYSFDVIECMVYYLEEIDIIIVGLFLFGNYNVFELLINVIELYFIILENILSFMGVFLFVVLIKVEVEVIVKEKGGIIYSWF